MSFLYPRKVLFRDCDPAGIAFYPRLVEMVNDAVEAFFADRLDWPFETLLRSHGVPTARLELRFRAPCRHGEALEIALTPVRVGRSSLDLSFEARCAGALRFEAASTLVLTDETGQSTPWPDHIRPRLTGDPA